MIGFDPAEIVRDIYSNPDLVNEDKENAPSEIGLPKEDVLNKLNLSGVPAQFIELLASKIEEELGSEITRIRQEDFLLIFSNWLAECQNAEEGSYYNDSFADLCNTSQLSDSRPDISGIYSQGHSPASSVSEENRDSVSQLSSITRSFSIPAHLNRPLFEETISVGSYTGYGGASPQKKLKESNSMELCNSKLAAEIANYKTYYQKSLSENERLQQTLDVKEKDYKAISDELEQMKKQYKMMKLTNENLNSDIDHMNEIREGSRKKDARIKELELELKSVNEDCEKAWERVNILTGEKDQLISDLEEERSRNIVLRQEMTIDRQEMANQVKELRMNCEELRQNLEDEKFRCAQVVKESEAKCREVEEYKSRVHELEEKMHDSGEVIYFSPEEQIKKQKNLQDEFEQSTDYRSFQHEEMQSLKKKLDEATRKAEIAMKEREEGLETVARLERELKTVRAITQTRKTPEKKIKKTAVANVAIQTSPLKETKKESDPKLSTLFVPQPKPAIRSLVKYPVLSTIGAICCVLLSIIVLMIWNWEGPIVDYSCPTLQGPGSLIII